MNLELPYDAFATPSECCRRHDCDVTALYVNQALQSAGADPHIFERGGPEAIIYKILEREGPKFLKMAFECSFQSFSNKSFASIPPRWGMGGGGMAP